MGTISDKLTYLNTTKGKIKDSINLTGAGITNQDTFRSYEKKLKDGLVDIINNGTDTVYNNFPKVTGTGSSATLNSTYQAPMKVGLKGNTYQGSDPTPSSPQDIEVVTGYNEVEIVGKNLFNKSNFPVLQGTVPDVNGAELTEAVKNRTTYIPCKPNTTYTIQRRNDGDTNRFGVAYTKTLPVLNVLCYGGIRNNDATSITITTGSDAKYLVVFFYRTDETTLTYQQVVDSIQIEQNSSATTYQAYQSQSYEINLGKNLLDLSRFKSITADSGITFTQDTTTGKVILNGTAAKNTFITYYTRIFKTGEVVSLSANNSTTNSNVAIRIHDIMSGHTTENTYLDTVNKKDEAITLTESYDSFQIRIANGTTLNNFELYPQVELGTQATPYSAYKTPIEICKIEDYQDEIRCSTGKNLFDILTTPFIAKVAYNGSGIQQEWSDYSGTTTKTKVIPNTTYTLTEDKNAYTTQIVEYDNSGNFISRQVLTNYAKTFTTGANTYYINLSISNEIIPTQVQLEQNNQATDYEPYGVGVWYKYGKIGKTVLNGSETYMQWNDQTLTNTCLFGTATIDSLINQAYVGLSNYFTNFTTTLWNNDTEGLQIASAVENKIRLRVNKNRLSSADVIGLKAWLSTYNTIIYYTLLTPTATVLDTELQTQLNNLKGSNSYSGQTNINAEYITGNQPFIMNLVALKDE